MKATAFMVPFGCVLLALASAGCAATSFSVPELDSYKLPSLHSGPFLFEKLRNGKSTKADVQRVLGNPPVGAVGGRSADEVILGNEWSYPVRVGSRIKAPMLKVRMDAAGLVADWGFYHPVTGQPLEIRETLEQAMGSARRAKSRVTILIADLLKPGDTTEEQLVSRLTFGSTPRYIRERAGDKVTLVFYVDRPSPLFVPPDRLVVRFNNADMVSVIYNEGSLFYGPGK